MAIVLARMILATLSPFAHLSGPLKTIEEIYQNLVKVDTPQTKQEKSLRCLEWIQILGLDKL
jgi:hypothetical protein